MPYQGLPALMVAHRSAKAAGGHERMADEVVGLAHEFVQGEPADADEFVVDEGDPSLGIGHGHDEGAFLEEVLLLGDRLVVAHGLAFIDPRVWGREANACSLPRLENVVEATHFTIGATGSLVPGRT